MHKHLDNSEQNGQMLSETPGYHQKQGNDAGGGLPTGHDTSSLQRPWRLRKRILLIVAAILIVVIAGLVWWCKSTPLRIPRPAQAPLPAPTATQFNATLAMLQDVAQTATANFGSEYTITVDPWEAENSFTGSTETANGFPFNILSGSGPTLLITQDGGPDPTSAASQPASAVYTALKPILTQSGFTEEPQSQPQGDGDAQSKLDEIDQPTASTSYTFIKQDTTCTVTVTTTNPGSSYIANSVFVYCQSPNIARYMASTLQPFAQVTATGLGVPLSKIVMGPVSIKTQPPPAGQTVAISESQTSGYELAESLFKEGNSRVWVGLYYNKDNAWHYITKATDEWGFPCTPVYANQDARKAMYNQVCYKSGLGQISVDSNRDPLP